jgi:GTP-binding protein
LAPGCAARLTKKIHTFVEAKPVPMKIISAEFRCSSAKIDQCPAGEFSEFAFIGRSNVGKSSLINMLTGRKGLAKVSGTPGKTRLINHFTINDEWHLVDLPGYGYARVSKAERSGFSKLIVDYVTKRENLVCLFVLVDSRLEPQKNDTEFLELLGCHDVPFALVFTKTDKLTDNRTVSNVARYKRFLRAYRESLPPIFITSSEKGRGRDDLLAFIENCIVPDKNPQG